MSLDQRAALALDPPERIVLTSPEDIVSWARSISDFGLVPEVFALFLDDDRALMRAVWLSEQISFDDFCSWPDFALGYAPSSWVGGVVLLVCRPDEEPDPTLADAETWDLMRLAHDAHGIPLLDVVMVDGEEWVSLAERLP
ncbi:MAG: hypothetical protein ACRDY7_05835 [Acidimicrobiia bacterium]